MSRNGIRKVTKIRRRLEILLVCGLILPFGPVGFAAEHQQHADILNAAAAFVMEHADRFPVAPEVVSGSLDSRLRLPRCSIPLLAYEPPNGLRSGRTVVGVRCEGEQPWKIFAPVRVKLPADIVAAARSLKRGEVLQQTDLVEVRKDIAKLHRDYFHDRSRLVGQRLRRSLKRGDVITPTAVEKRKLVRRGTDVTILAAKPQFQVRMRGKAMANGTQGDRIKIKNLSSGREVTATVIGSGLVQVVH